MRLLLLSDTHGHLDIVDKLARDTSAEAVLHAGDFGFFDAESHHRLTMRQLGLLILHSGLPAEQIRQARKLTPPELVEFAVRWDCMGRFPGYLAKATMPPGPSQANQP
jgi:hypothetical protein